MARGPTVGDQAPDFTLEGPEGSFTLSEQRGHRVILLFYPGDETVVCTKQFCSYRDRAEEMEELDATVVGISTRDVESKRAFRDHHGLNVPLLADADGAVARSYGVRTPVMTRRATFVVDEQGVVRARNVHSVGLTFETVDDLREMLAAVGAAA